MQILGSLLVHNISKKANLFLRLLNSNNYAWPENNRKHAKVFPKRWLLVQMEEIIFL